MRKAMEELNTAFLHFFVANHSPPMLLCMKEASGADILHIFAHNVQFGDERNPFSNHNSANQNALV